MVNAEGSHFAGLNPAPITHSGVAQPGIEHLIWDQGVVGSNPTTATRKEA